MELQLTWIRMVNENLESSSNQPITTPVSIYLLACKLDHISIVVQNHYALYPCSPKTRFHLQFTISISVSIPDCRFFFPSRSSCHTGFLVLQSPYNFLFSKIGFVIIFNSISFDFYLCLHLRLRLRLDNSLFNSPCFRLSSILLDSEAASENKLSFSRSNIIPSLQQPTKSILSITNIINTTSILLFLLKK